jgi:hypothetical protein
MFEDGSIEIAREERKGNLVTYWYKAVEIPAYSKEAADVVEEENQIESLVRTGSGRSRNRWQVADVDVEQSDLGTELAGRF